MPFETISVIGLGYIGLPTAAMFASRGTKVIGVDKDSSVVEVINRGEIHIFEPDLDILVQTTVNAGLLKAVTKPETADAFLIAVPTPFKNNKGSIPEPDLSHIKTSINSIAQVLKKGDLVILESTSPVGTTEKLAEWLAELRTDLRFPQQVGERADVNIAYCPERVLPGNVMIELVNNDRLIGGLTNVCSQRAIELYRAFVEGDCVATNARTAEMSKLTENSCRDVQIAFANELSIICDKLDIDVWELIALANRHPRVNILQPGPGVGGHCIAVDPWFIVSRNPAEARLISTARVVNDTKPSWVIEKVKVAIDEVLLSNPSRSLKDVSIGCFGLTFKPDIDDLRGSPALWITTELARLHDGAVFAVEPNINEIANERITLISYAEAIERVDVAVLLVDHKEFKQGSPQTRHVIDTKGIWT